MRTTMAVAAILSQVACGSGGADVGVAGDDALIETVQLELTGATKLGGGAAYSCALLASGQITCWDTPGLSLPFSDYVDIAPGAHHFCSLRSNGDVTCQKVDSFDNGFGELNAPPIPMVDVSAGLQVTCGIRDSDRQLQCWGRNDHGQANPPAGMYSRVEMGWLHGCAVRLDGAGVDCWGFNAHGQANGYTGPIVDLSAGAYHTCYIRAEDDLPICSDGSFPLPLPVPLVQLSAGLAHTCGLTPSGVVRCWGDNSFGQAGTHLGMTTSVGVGANHSCRARARNDLVVCWGNNDFGQSSPPP